MTSSAGPAAADQVITGIVAMIRVADIERSGEFYRLLGFEIGNWVPRGGGPKAWAWLYAPAAPDWRRGPNLMLTRSEEPVTPDEQVLFYLYAADLQALRSQLLASGLAPGEIVYPEYLPKGEFGLTDPDGYCLMIAQSSDDTP